MLENNLVNGARVIVTDLYHGGLCATAVIVSYTPSHMVRIRYENDEVTRLYAGVDGTKLLSPTRLRPFRRGA